MRLKMSRVHAEENLITLINSGYVLLNWLEADHKKHGAGQAEHEARANRLEKWGQDVLISLHAIFPTELEANQFRNPPEYRGMRTIGANEDGQFRNLKEHAKDLIEGLNPILKENLDRYTDLPLTDRLHIEDIDSYRNVRDVNPHMVADLLENGRWDVSEDFVQMSLEQILGVSFHKKDWGGEYNDLFTANVVVNGQRRPSAFLLKGNGLKKKTMQIGDCGKNGDQIVRLFESPAELFFIQYVGDISESVVKDVSGKVAQCRANGKEAWFCIIDGQDTARLCKAYGIEAP